LSRRCFVVEFKEPLGYGDGLTFQERAFEKVSAGEADGILLLLEHKPVFTVGRSGEGKTCSWMKGSLRLTG